MTLEMTKEQQELISRESDQVHKLLDPQTQLEYALVDFSKHQEIAEILEEKRLLRGIARISMRNAIRRTLEE